jgi:hypothetical protein
VFDGKQAFAKCCQLADESIGMKTRVDERADWSSLSDETIAQRDWS